MMTYREIRTITGRKMFVRETREQRLDRLILRAEIVLTPIVTILVWAAVAGMI